MWLYIFFRTDICAIISVQKVDYFETKRLTKRYEYVCKLLIIRVCTHFTKADIIDTI